ncbi:MAG: translocation/assembly module TamB domain-containing protein [Sediminibacterium sp.]|nr:translocation/assembly module TamB domain-containing protein [Sediminibacterium sp.]
MTIARRTILIFIAILLVLYIAIQTDYVQNKLVHYATGKLSKALGTEVRIRQVSISLFNKLNLEGMLVRDQKKDTILYAGQLKVRMTDWFFLRNKAVLKYVGLEDAVVKLQRTDSVWNYQFIADYFASPSPKPKDTTGGLELDLKKIDLKNVHFLNNDLWTGDILDARVASLVLDADKIDLKNKRFNISSVVLNKPQVTIYSLVPLRPPHLKRKAPAVPDTGLYYNAGWIDLNVQRMQLINGGLNIEGNLEKPYPGFDGSHIRLSKLSGSINRFHFQKDTLTALVHLSAKDRSGLELKKLKANFRLTPQIMELANLDLQTNKSRLTNYYAMKFNNFNEDFAEYVDSVVMVARFNYSNVHSDDIAFFAPELKSWKKEAILTGNFIGTVTDFKVTGFNARIGTTTAVNGTLAMKGLPEIDKTIISFNNGSVQTNVYDLSVFVPALGKLEQPNLAALGQILYRGSYNGTIHRFRTSGILSTKLGGLKADISMKLPAYGEPVYDGNIEAIRFNAGKFLSVDELGAVDFKGKVTGSSFNINRLKTQLNGIASSIEYNNYKYTNITANGTVQKKYFNGELEINDPNLGFTADVEVDFSKEEPLFNIVGDLSNSNLQALNFLKEKIQVVGLLDVNFTGSNIDKFIGTAKFLNAEIRSSETNVRFDSLNLTSDYSDSLKTLHVGSNDFNATVKGRFSIMELPASFQAFLYNYYPAYIKPLKSTPRNQQFTFSINTGYFEPYIRLFEKNVSGFNDVMLNGSINTSNNKLGVDAYIPYGRYKNYSGIGFSLTGNGNFDSLAVSSTIKSIELGDSMRLPNSVIHITSRKDHSVVAINTSASNALNEASLNADVYTLDDGVKVQFRPSSFVLNNKAWHIEKSGFIEIRKKLLNAQNVKFTQGFQEITVEPGRLNGVGNYNNLVVKLKNLILGDITSLFMKNPRLEGLTTGSVNLYNFFDDFSADAELKTEEFSIDEDSVGVVFVNAGYRSSSGLIPFKVISPNSGYNFTADGSYNLKDSTGKSFTTTIELNRSRIGIVEQFLKGLFSDLSGEATGALTISGDPNAPDLLGNIELRKGGLKVDYTQVYYTIDSALIRFQEDGINFGRFTIYDQYKNKGTVAGKLYEKNFKNMVFDFDLSTDKLLLIDTKATDNQQFYGRAIGKASMSFKGPETGCKMVITAESNDSSHITIPNSVSRESGAADFIVFKQYGTEMEQIKPKSNFNLSVDLDVTANNKVQIDVILDELTGDVIKAVGNGRLRIKAGTIDPLTIKGRYNIERGKYDFNFQSLLKKPFDLMPNAGNYIEWNGDPYKAELSVDALYTAERVSLSDLIGKNSFSGLVKGYRGDVLVIASLRNQLSKPDIKFRLDFPQGSPIKNDNEFAQFLTRIQKDENEMLKQVSFLIVFNSFAPPGETSITTGSNPYSFSSIGINSLSQILTKEVNKAVSNLLYKITRDKSLRFDLGASLYSSSSIFGTDGTSVQANSNRLDRSRVNFKVGRSFFNNNVTVTFGGDLDFNLGNSSSVQSGNFQWLPDLNIEIILSQDRKLRAIIFSKNSLDISGANFGRRNRQGASISFRQDFESLFGAKQEPIEVSKPETDSTRKQ